MPHFKDTTNGLHFLDDAAFLHLLPAGSMEITDEEAEQSRQQAQADAAPATLAAQAQAILDANDKTATRLWKSGKPWPADWQAYEDGLRAAVRGEVTCLPTEPALKPWEY